MNLKLKHPKTNLVILLSSLVIGTTISLLVHFDVMKNFLQTALNKPALTIVYGVIFTVAALLLAEIAHLIFRLIKEPKAKKTTVSLKENEVYSLRDFDPRKPIFEMYNKKLIERKTFNIIGDLDLYYALNKKGINSLRDTMYLSKDGSQSILYVNESNGTFRVNKDITISPLEVVEKRSFSEITLSALKELAQFKITTK